MNDWNELFKTTVALLAIVNPVGGVPMFLSTTGEWSPEDRRRTARTVAITVFLVLTVSAFFGNLVLEFFAISIPSFQVGGGILLMLLAVSMMQARESGLRQTPQESEETAERHAVAVVPLAIPLLAGPGAISTMIIASHRVPGFSYQLKLLAPAGIIAVTVWITLRVSSHLSNRLGTTGMNIITRIMGLMLAALAVEFIAHGLQELFPGLA
ncbi:MAG: MarC family protein [Burkholderiales bacterium]